MPSYPGIWRGLIEKTVDSEQRKRYRVRVVNVHRDEVPVDKLPWAEFCTFAGKGFGDIPHFEVGDLVFVCFERGDRRFPVIMGGWLSYGGGTPDLPAEQTGDYERLQRVWIRTDRFGNRILMDPDNGFIELQSTESTVTIHGEEGSVKIETDARVMVRSPQVQVLEASEVTVEAGKVFAQVADECSVVCEDVVTIRSANTINIGRYEDEVMGALAPKTTDTVDIRADSLIKAESGDALDVDVAGQADVDVIGDINITCSATTNVNITTEANVHCDGPINVDGETILVQSTGGLLRIESSDKIEIEATADAEITVGGSATVDVGANCDVTVAGAATLDVSANCDVTVAGNATIESTGVAKLASSSRVELEAPTIDISASSLLTMEGSATTSIDGGVILIG